ncbi:MAG: hypothetical protein RLZZ203_568, partial [Cyanobacteriota bacterium]
MLRKLRKFVRSSIAKISAIVFLTILSVIAGNLFAATKVNSAPTANDITCPPAPAGKMYRFIEGIDKCLVPLSQSELEELNDPFATKILRKGIYPDTVADLDKKIGDKLGYKPTT